MSTENHSSAASKTILISGASRGIGRAIALKAASEGMNVIVLAKTTEKHPHLDGTIYSVADEIKEAGGKAFPFQCDVRFETEIKSVFDQITRQFSAIDVLVHNAGAIALNSLENCTVKQIDLMHNINCRAPMMLTLHALDLLKQSTNPHIIHMSPPINLNPKWFKNHTPYTISKYGMSMLTLGLSEEFKPHRIAVNSLWPRTLIATAAVKNILGGAEMIKRSRKPEIVADAAACLWRQDSQTFTGNHVIDEEVLRAFDQRTEFDQYAVDPTLEPIIDLYLEK